MKAVAEEVDVHFVGHHFASRLGISDKEHVLVRCASERDATRFADEAACSIASRDPGGSDLAFGTVGVFDYRVNPVGILLKAEEFRVPMDRAPELTQVIAQETLVVVLS